MTRTFISTTLAAAILAYGASAQIKDSVPTVSVDATPGRVINSFDPDSALRIMKDRQAKGINVILVMLTGVDTGKVDSSLPPSFANLEGELPWIENDPLRPNERYFRHIDRMIRLGEQTGQTLVVGVFHQWHAGIITPGKAREWAKRAVAMEPEDSAVLYNVACVYTQLGLKDSAIDCLEQAIKNGFGHWEWIEHDSDLDALRDHARFKNLMQQKH